MSQHPFQEGFSPERMQMTVNQMRRNATRPLA